MAAPAMSGGERYEVVREIASGAHGVAMLMRDRFTGQLVAFKYIERGAKIDEKVVQEIINHRLLRHPNIVRFKEVILTPTHLAIVMEYVSGGELFHRISKYGRLNEDEARFFFQQIISGVGYCHSMEVCHRDLKPENLLLDEGPYPLLKICDFGYSKSLLQFPTKSVVGTIPCVAPEVILEKSYNGKMADIWSCGVTLYVMLVGAYPFEDPKDPTNVRETYKRISSAQYSVPEAIHISPECCHLISRIFLANPALRITIPEIQRHEWFLKNLPAYLLDAHSLDSHQSDQPMQSIDQIMQIIREATIPGLRGPHQYQIINYMDCDTEDEGYASEDFEYATESDEDSTM